MTRPQAAALLADGVELLADYQDRLAAQDTFGVLLVLQGIDSAGKDSTIKHVMSGVNPQAVEVRAFKQPSAEELNHDFLWRYQRALPGRGRIGIFNRSHYEEVLVVRVHEELLAAERIPLGALPGRQRDPRRQGPAEPVQAGGGQAVSQAHRPPGEELEVLPRRRQGAALLGGLPAGFEAMLSQTSTMWAPWCVVPADHKWFSRLATAAVLVTCQHIPYPPAP